jgi:hypothetical protein
LALPPPSAQATASAAEMNRSTSILGRPEEPVGQAEQPRTLLGELGEHFVDGDHPDSEAPSGWRPNQ